MKDRSLGFSLAAAQLYGVPRLPTVVDMSFLLTCPLVAAPEGQAVFFPASYNFAWAAAVVAVVAGVIWMIVTVVRSPLTGVAKASWIAVAIALPLVGVVAWFVLGRDARLSGTGSVS